jgi:hypothetical protein
VAALSGITDPDSRTGRAIRRDPPLRSGGTWRQAWTSRYPVDRGARTTVSEGIPRPGHGRVPGPPVSPRARPNRSCRDCLVDQA